MENVKIRTIHLEEHVVARGLGGLRRCLSLQARAAHQIRRAAGIGNQLANDHSLAEAVEEPGSGEISGPDPRQVVALGACQIASYVGVISGAILDDLLIGIVNLVLRGLDLRMILQRDRLRLLQG